MPRVHGIDINHRRHSSNANRSSSNGGGIFSLATPFGRPQQPRHQVDRGHQAGHHQAAADWRHCTSGRGDDINGERRGGASSVSSGNTGRTTSMQSISSVVKAPEREKELTAASPLEVSVAPTATTINTMEQHLSMNKQQSHQQPQQQHPTKYNGMNDGCNDNDSATTMGGDDDEGSVVLLNDNDGGDEGGRGGELKCKSSTISNNGSANTHSTPSLPHKSGKLKQSLQQQQHSPKAPLSLSPATQTLDRLANFGSQQGGAELCIHLLANAAAERIGEGNKGRTSDGSVGGEGGRDSNDLQKMAKVVFRRIQLKFMMRMKALPKSVLRPINPSTAKHWPSMPPLILVKSKPSLPTSRNGNASTISKNTSWPPTTPRNTPEAIQTYTPNYPSYHSVTCA